MKKILFSTLIIISASIYAQESIFTVKDDAFWSIVPKDLQVEQVASGYKFTEGPVWHKDGFLLFSDIPANIIYKLTPEGKSSVYITPSGNSNGLTFDKNGNLVACEHSGRRVSMYDKKTGGLKVLTDKINGKKLNSPNDVVFRKSGDYYFTDPPYGLKKHDNDSTKELKINGVYLVKNGTPILIDSTLKRPNGVALSPDEKILYVAQSEFTWLWKVYQLNDEGLPVSSSIMMQQPEITGNPDGVKVDVEGNIYCSGNHGVVIFDKTGKYLGSIKLPENTANLCFGDKDLQSLYVTAQKSIYRIKLKKKGHLAY